MQKQFKLLKNKNMLLSTLMSILYKLKRNNNSNITLYIIGLAAFIGIITISVDKISISPQDTTETSKPADTAKAIGQIEPHEKIIKLTPAQNLGETKISRLLVTEGSRVAKGETLALLDSHQQANAAVKLAGRQVEAAEASLTMAKNISVEDSYLEQAKLKLESEIIADKAKVALLEIELSKKQAELQARIINGLRIKQVIPYDNFQRHEQSSFKRLTTKRLQNDSFETQSEYSYNTFTLQQQINRDQEFISQKKRTLQKQSMKMEALSDSVDSVKETDIIQVQQKFDKAISTYRQVKKDLELTYIKAPTDGKIVKIHAYPGEIVGKDGIVEFAQNIR